MQNVTIQFLINTRKVNKDNSRVIYVRLYDTYKKYFLTTGLKVKDAKELEKIKIGAYLTHDQSKIKDQINIIEAKVKDILEAMAKDYKFFDIDVFKELYDPTPTAKPTNDYKSIAEAYRIKIGHLIDNRQLKTAQTYDLACKSLTAKNNRLRFSDITPDWLKTWHTAMTDKGRSPTTVSMYVRTLRTLFNDGIELGYIDRAKYPFGKKKYKVPAAKNIKKAIPLHDIGLIYHYDCPTDFQSEAKDYWVFMYLNNGMNVKDMALLKWKDYDGDTITYIRAKTATTSKEIEAIPIPVSDETKEIINRRGRRTLNKTDYIFPILHKSMDEGQKMRAVQQAVQNINKNMKKITQALGLPKVTTYTARHSYATAMLHSGQSHAFIGKQLGHSDPKTTDNYLKSFNIEVTRKANEALTNFN